MKKYRPLGANQLSNSKKSIKILMTIAAILQIIWGIVPSASKLVLSEIPVELFITLRWTVSGLIFCAMVFFSSKWPPLLKKDTAGVAILGILGYGIASFGTLYGLKIGGVTNFTLMGSVSPIVTSLAAIVLLNEKPRRLFYLALSMCVFGLTFLMAGKHQISSWHITLSSSGLILAAAFLESIVLIFSKRLKTHFSSIEYLAISQVSAAIFMWAMQLLCLHQLSEIHNLSLKGWCAFLFVSLVACVLCYLILYWLLNFIEGHRLALFDSLHTLSGTLVGIIVFQEQIHPFMVIGALLIVSGLFIGNLKKSTT